MAVHLRGHPSDQDSILGLAKELDRDVTEDADHSLSRATNGAVIGCHVGSDSIPYFEQLNHETLTCHFFKRLTPPRAQAQSQGGFMVRSARGA